MKIAIVCPYSLDHPGGVQNQALLLGRWLQDAGHDVRVVAPGRGGHAGTVPLGATVSVPANRSRAPIALDPRVARRVADAIAGVDVVHVHEPFMPLVSTVALRRAAAPVVGTFHADPGRWVRAMYGAGRTILQRLASRLAVATAVSPIAQAAVSRIVDARIVPNGIDAAAFDLDEERVPLRVAFVGRDDPRKGLDVLLQAWPGVRLAHPGAELVVIGAERPDSPPGVVYLGRIPDKEKARRLAGSTVLVAPNLGGESFGLVVAEGMAAGCAVVASGLSAFAAVAGDAAILVPPGDAPALGAAVGRLLADPDTTANLGRLGRQRVAAFDRPAVMGGYVAAYQDAVAAAGR